MAEVGLERAQGAGCAAAGAQAEGARQGRDFDGIAERRAGAVRLDVADARSVHAGRCLRPRDDRRLPVDGRRGDAYLARAVVVDRRAEDDGVDGIAVGHGVLEAPQRHDAGAAAPHRAVGPGVEGAAAAGRRVDAALAVQVAGLLRHLDRDPAGQGQVAVAGQQRPAGEVHGDQRCRAGGLHVDARTAQVEPVGDLGRQVVTVVGHRHLVRP